MRRLLRSGGLRTICEEARCPNRSECFERKTATFLILGTRCTRACGFCDVEHGLQGSLPEGEIEGIVQAAKRLVLRFLVLTMVARDDLPDGGAGYIAGAILRIRENLPGIGIEILASDLKGRRNDIATILESGPDVFAHNLETVRRLTRRVRTGATYDRSLAVLRIARELRPGGITKSGLMVGLGETEEEILRAMDDLRSVDCDVLTIGQYLQPRRSLLPVHSYWPPEAFERLREAALARGFRSALSGPFVRSSYRAEEIVPATE